MPISKKQFVFTIGDSGVSLVLIHADKLVQQLYIPEINKDNLEKLKAIIDANSKVPIKIVLNHSAQIYDNQSIPAINSWTLREVVSNRLKREFDLNQIYGAYYLKSSSKNSTERQVMFVSCIRDEKINTCLDFLGQFNNSIYCILFLPLEIENMYNMLLRYNNEHNLVIKQGSKNISDPDIRQLVIPEFSWHIFIFLTKLSGFRFIALRNGQIAFARSMIESGNKFTDVVAGEIEQEIQNTLEYIYSGGKTTKCSILLVLPHEIGRYINSNRFDENNVILHVITPQKLAVCFKLNNIIDIREKYADVLLSAITACNRPLLPLHVNKTAQDLKYYILTKVTLLVTCVVALISAFIIGNSTYDMVNSYISLRNSFQKTNKAQKDLEDFVKMHPIDKKHAFKNIDLIYLYNKLSNPQDESPIDILYRFYKMKPNNLWVSDIDWTIKMTNNILTHNEGLKTKKIEDDMSYLQDNILHNPKNNSKPTSFNLLIKASYTNDTNNFQDLVSGYTQTMQLIKKTFSEFTVQYSNIVESISINTTSNEFNTEIVITNDKDKLNLRH